MNMIQVGGDAQTTDNEVVVSNIFWNFHPKIGKILNFD